MTIYSRVLGVALAGMTAVGALAVITGNAQAKPPAEPSGGRAASFHGGSIDLTNGWGEAQSCVVFGPSDTRCYATHAEADTVLGYSRATDPLANDAARQGLDPAAIPACASGWLCLFEHTNGGGRRLIFNDEYFHWLDDWGFSRK